MPSLYISFSSVINSFFCPDFLLIFYFVCSFGDEMIIIIKNNDFIIINIF